MVSLSQTSNLETRSHSPSRLFNTAINIDDDSLLLAASLTMALSLILKRLKPLLFTRKHTFFATVNT